jgi:hypothetical protein
VVIVINNSDKHARGLIFGWAYIRGGGLILGMRWALAHLVGLHTGGGLYSEEGAYVRRFTVHYTLNFEVFSENQISVNLHNFGVNRKNTPLKCKITLQGVFLH